MQVPCSAGCASRILRYGTSTSEGRGDGGCRSVIIVTWREWKPGGRCSARNTSMPRWRTSRLSPSPSASWSRSSAGTRSGTVPALAGRRAACSTWPCSRLCASGASSVCTCAEPSRTAVPPTTSGKCCCRCRCTAAFPPGSKHSRTPPRSWTPAARSPPMPSPNRGPERPAGMPAEAETFGTEVAGFVGAGAMGAPMIAAIAAGGFRLRVFDAEPSRAQAAVDTARRGRDDADCATVGTLAEMAGCDLVITMLPDGSAVEQVAGERGLAALLRPGSLVVDMSSSAPAQTLALHQTLTARGLRLMDAPVSGGVARARDRALTIIAGGDPPDLAYARPVLQTMGSAIYHVGGTGSGHAAKALNNVLSACGLLISVEAIEAGRRFGLEPEVLLDL